MKQLVHSPQDGVMSVREVPAISPRRGMVLVKTAVSLVSAGTERMAVEFAEKSLLAKAESRPDLVKQVFDRAKREGLLNTIDAVRTRLSQPASLGYSAAGTVLEVGAGVTRFRPRDRVACAGANYAVHAEIICVPENLVACIPAFSNSSGDVTFEQAAFTTLGAIALHGFRLAEVSLGESVAVIGLGLLGLITVQLAKAAGCYVIGLEPNSDRAELGRRLGCAIVAHNAEEMQAAVQQITAGAGADAVIITAATESNGPVELAGTIARGRAHVISVGAVGTELPRKSYFEKELKFMVSRSYGPGRYDVNYEEKGQDYPAEFVRWTENRNMSSFLELLSRKSVDVAPLVTHRFPIDSAAAAYDLISGKRQEPFLAVLLTYPEVSSAVKRVELKSHPAASPIRLGMLGAGSFAMSTLLPAIQSVKGIDLVGIAAGSGVSARHAGEKFAFRYCAADQSEVLQDERINTVAIATRHNSHARQVLAAMAAGKNVFCEKPLCLNPEELSDIIKARKQFATPHLMVGFNRRFAPLAHKLRHFLAGSREPLSITYRVNAGYIPESNWTQDPEQGGGRVIGEVCHFVDFVSFLTGASPVNVYSAMLANDGRYAEDNLHINLQLEDGSIATIVYLANGDKHVPKERVEVFCAGSVAILDDFRSLELVRDGRSEETSLKLRQDKGHRREWEIFADSITHAKEPPIAFRELVATTLTTFKILESSRTGRPVPIHTDDFIASALELE